MTGRYLSILAVSLMACGQDAGTSQLPVELTTEPMFVDGKCMAWDGDAYAVVWVGRTAELGDIFFTRVAPDGQVLFAPERLYQGVEHRVSTCHLVPQGESYLLVLQMNGEGSDQFVFYPNGTSQGSPQEIFDSSAAHDVTMRSGVPHILHTESGSVAGTYSYYLRVHADSIPDPPVIAPHTSGKYDPEFSWRAEEGVYLAVWRRSNLVRFGRIDALGAFVDPEDPLFDTGNSQYGPVELLPDGNGGMLVAWIENDQWTFLAADTTGVPIWAAPVGLLPPNRAAWPALSMVFMNDQPYAVWRSDHETSLAQIYSARIDASAEAVSDITMLSDPQYDYRDPVAVASETEIAVLFEGRAAGTERLYWTTTGQ